MIATAKVKQIDPDRQVIIDALNCLLDLANRGQINSLALAVSEPNNNKRIILFADTLDEKFILVNELQMQIAYDKMRILDELETN